MIIISGQKKIGLSFYYPLAVGILKKKPIKVIPWARYKKFLPFFSAFSVIQIIFGLALGWGNVYSDHLYNIYALMNIVIGASRLFVARASDEILITQDTSTTVAPFSAWVDFGGYYINLCLMLFILAEQSSRSAAVELSAISVCFFLLAMLPLLNRFVFVLFGIGKIKNS